MFERKIIDMQNKRSEVETFYQWKEWVNKIPFITFDQNWEVKIIPPNNFSVVKFQLRQKEKIGSWLSVSLDGDNFFGGLSDHPYWEVYPVNSEGEFTRVPMNNVDELLNVIRTSFSQQ